MQGHRAWSGTLDLLDLSVLSDLLDRRDPKVMQVRKAKSETPDLLDLSVLSDLPGRRELVPFGRSMLRATLRLGRLTKRWLPQFAKKAAARQSFRIAK